jgi:hypothetical protein
MQMTQRGEQSATAPVNSTEYNLVESKTPASSSTSPIKRIPEPDVRAIFEFLHEAKPLPSHLKFQILPSVPNGEKLSPPSCQFEGTGTKSFWIQNAPLKLSNPYSIFSVSPLYSH